MACRHLGITFHENGDVAYRFFRHHAKFLLSKYLIEYPVEKVVISGGQATFSDHYRQSVTPAGHLLVEWDRVEERETRSSRGLDYVKRDFLEQISDNPLLYRYRERIAVKPDFTLCLHGPRRRLSAVRARSSALFVGDSGREVLLQPHQLQEYVVRDEAGHLDVDWVLEVDESVPVRTGTDSFDSGETMCSS